MGFFLVFVNFISFYILWGGVAYCAKIHKLERKLNLIETRQNLESLTRKDETSSIFERLDSFETRLNESQENPQCCVSDDSDYKTTSGVSTKKPMLYVQKLMKAFKEEKRTNTRLRRHVDDLGERVHSLENELCNMSDKIEVIANQMCTKTQVNMVMKAIRSVNYTVFDLNKLGQEKEEKLQSGTIRIEEKLENVTRKLEQAQTEYIEITNTVLDHLKAIENLIKNKVNESIANALNSLKRYSSCFDLHKAGINTDGVNDVYPEGYETPVQVYCDMKTDGGGWTVFQRRKDGSVDFFRNWDDYEHGFGDLTGEFWLGNKHLSAMTKTCCHELRIDLGDFEGRNKYAKYGKFQVLSASENYKLVVGQYSGDAGDSLSYHSGMGFSTKDRDNDKYRINSCAETNTGAWWYRECHHSNLNGRYLGGPGTARHEGVIWKDWRGYSYSLKLTEMKFR